MKIGIDISMLVYQGSGVATYTHNLVSHLLKYNNNEYRLFYSSFRRPKNFYYLDEFKKLGAKLYDFRFPPSLLKLWWNKYHLFPVEWFIGKVDIYHTSDFLRPPLLRGTRGITTIHDLTWTIFPQFHTKEIVKAHERKMEKTIKYGDIIIVDSHNTKNDLLKYYPEAKNRNKIYVIHPGVDERFRPIKDRRKIKKILAKYNISYPKNYLLYVGAIEPRKNLTTAIKVFYELITGNSGKPSRFDYPVEDRISKVKKVPTNPYSDYKFLIVGRAGWKNEEVFSLIKELNLQNKVRFVGYVEDDDLPYFYNAARVFIYLSKYEGFGLPPIEAAACGCPTLLCNSSSLNEIFKPGYPYAKEGRVLETLKRLINDSSFNVSNFTYDFSWEKYYYEFLKIITSL